MIGWIGLFLLMVAYGMLITKWSSLFIPIDTIASLMNTKLEIISDKRRVRPQKSEVDRLLSNNTKARKILNWEPKTKRKYGLINTIENIKQII